MSLDIHTIDIHRACKLAFSNESYGNVFWLKMKIFCDTIGRSEDSICLFYGSSLKSEDVDKAMIRHLESEGYSVSKKEKEHASNEV